jgi:hypothetical protein
MIEENNARGQRLIEISSGHVFGVGPGRIPMDVVPDRGATLPLLGLALVGLLMGRKYRELDQT